MKLDVDVDGYWYVTNPADPDDSWDRDDTSFVFNGFTIKRNVDGEFDVSELYPGDTAFLVYCSYNTGDTFKHEDSLIKPLLIVKLERDADELVGLLRNESGWDLNWRGNRIYIPWNGYFESLNDIQVATFLAPYSSVRV